jgi:hypothetical protein
MGTFWNSYNDVRLEKARVNQLVTQLDELITQNLSGAPTAINNTTQLTTNQLSILVPSYQDEGNDSLEQYTNDWNTFYSSWQGFYSTGVDQTSTLWFPNFSDSAEWQACMVYESALQALQTRYNALVSSEGNNVGTVPVVPPTETPGGGLSVANLFPWFTPALGNTLTNGFYAIAGLYAAFTFFPALGNVATAVTRPRAAAAPVRRTNPRRRARRRSRRR